MDKHTEITGSPRLTQVLDEIAWFRARIRESARNGRDAVREARAAYAPFLQRRLELLAALRGASSRSAQGPHSDPSATPHRERGPWWRQPS